MEVGPRDLLRVSFGLNPRAFLKGDSRASIVQPPMAVTPGPGLFHNNGIGGYI